MYIFISMPRNRLWCIHSP